MSAGLAYGVDVVDTGGVISVNMEMAAIPEVDVSREQAKVIVSGRHFHFRQCVCMPEV